MKLTKKQRETVWRVTNALSPQFRPGDKVVYLETRYIVSNNKTEWRYGIVQEQVGLTVRIIGLSRPDAPHSDCVFHGWENADLNAPLWPISEVPLGDVKKYRRKRSK